MALALVAPPWSFVWQALHLVTSTFTLCGTRGMHLVTSTFTLCGRCGTYGTGLALVACLVPVCPPEPAQCHKCHACHTQSRSMSPSATPGTMARAWFPFVAVVAAALCVAGVAFRSIDLHSVAGVALGNIDLHFEWQAWQLMALGWPLVPVCRRCRRGSLCGRRMQAWHSESSTSILCGGRDIDLHFVWHLWRWAGSWWHAWFPFVDIATAVFVWQAWLLVTSTFTLCGTRGMHLVTSTFTLCGRCGTYGSGEALDRGWSAMTPRSLCGRRGAW